MEDTMTPLEQLDGIQALEMEEYQDLQLAQELDKLQEQMEAQVLMLLQYFLLDIKVFNLVLLLRQDLIFILLVITFFLDLKHKMEEMEQEVKLIFHFLLFN